MEETAKTETCVKESRKSDFHVQEGRKSDFQAQGNGKLDYHVRSKAAGFISHIREDSIFRLRLLNTAYVVWMYITLGWNIAVVGSTFPDIRLIIKKDLDTASWMFTDFSIGYMVGALIFGNLYDRFNRLIILSIAPIVNAALFAAAPWCEDFTVFLVVVFFNGVFSGGIDVGGNTHVTAMWGRKTAPYMQAIHFGFSFGGILSPLSAQPFVAEKQCTTSIDGFRNDTTTSAGTISIASVSTSAATTITTTTTAACEEFYGETNVQFAYLIGAFITLTASVPYIISFIFFRKQQAELDIKHDVIDNEEDKSRDKLPELSIKKKCMFVALLMVLISNYASTENRFAGLLSSFVLDFQDWTKVDSLRVTSLFWGTFAAGRFISIGVAKFLKPSTMILIYVLSLTTSFVGFLIASKLKISALIWLFTATSGLCTSAIYPAIFTWTAESILTVTGKIAATYSVGVSIFNGLVPLLYGYLMDNVNIVFFAYLLVGQSAFCLALYIVIRFLASIYIKPVEQEKPSQDIAISTITKL